MCVCVGGFFSRKFDLRILFVATCHCIQVDQSKFLKDGTILCCSILSLERNSFVTLLQCVIVGKKPLALARIEPVITEVVR